MGTYNNYTVKNDNDEFQKLKYVTVWNSTVRNRSISNIDNETVKNTIINHRKNFMLGTLKKFGIGDGANNTYISTTNANGGGKSNALRINDAGNGLKSYYWDKDIDTGDKNLLEGVHTATVEYNGMNTNIYIDGKLAKSGITSPNTIVREITIGATNMNTIAEYKDNKAILDTGTEGYVNSTNWTESISTVDSYFYFEVVTGLRNHVDFYHSYTEFLNNSVYSVRIYNRALSQGEIMHNYITDYYRFGSGT